MIRNIIRSIEAQAITIPAWISAFMGIVLVRCFLEALSSHSSSGIIASDAQTLVHYALFYFTTCSGLMLILYLVTKNIYIHKLALFGMLIIWFAPLFDLVSTGGVGAPMFYFFENGGRLLHEFVTFFLPHINVGITHGIRIEIALVLFSCGWYLWSLAKSTRVILGTVAALYVFIFTMLSVPGELYTISHAYSENAPRSVTITFIERTITHSNIRHNSIHDTLAPKTFARMVELGFDALSSQLYILLSFVITLIFFWQSAREKTVAVLKNSRPGRVGFYCTLLLLGMQSAYVQGLGSISSWADILSILVLLLSWYAAWMFAVHTNDITDEKIDAVSNSNRPLIAKALTEHELRDSGYIWLILSLLGSFSVGYYPYFMNIMFTVAYYIYSAHPLRLKRVPLLSSFLISVACLSTIMAGFFFLSENKVFTTFPTTTALQLLLIFTLAVNVRDIKDIEGDKAEGIKTLPVLFGKNGIKITALLFAVSFLLIPIVLKSVGLFTIALPAAIIGYIIVTRTLYKERYVFYLYFTVALCVATFLQLS